jgi:ankyrin repeat protein
MMRSRFLAPFAAASLFASVTLVAAAPAEAPLADAMEKMDRTAVRTLLQKRADVNAPQIDGMTALHWAAYQDDLDSVELLLRSGANVKAVNRYGIAPLTLAITNADSAMVDKLLQAGADPNTTLPGGETSLMTAARVGQLASVKALIARGATIDAKDEKHGQTALMWAAAEGHAPVVEMLIEMGSDYKTRLPSGMTPLLFAIREGHTDVVRVLLKAGVDVNEPVPAEGGRRRTVGGRALPPGATPLLTAVMNGHFELAAQLLDAGADPNAHLTGYTALHAIVPVRKPGVGDNDPAPEGSGTMSSLELVRKLVEKGADLNARMSRRANLCNTRLNEVGATPFMMAALTDDAELMRELAKLGADPFIPTVDNTTALIVAAGVASRSPGEDAGTEEETVEAVQVALDLGIDINAVDMNGETAMHAAAYKNLPKVVKHLASKGAKIDVWNKNDKYGWTPLAIAVGYRFGNFKPSPETEAAIREVMIANGVTPPKVVNAKTQQIY